MNIALIGFMGSGKSSVGKTLAKELHIDYISMDEEILKESKLDSINQIFEKHGELKFRELEINTAKMLPNLDNIVIDTGGGVVENKIIIDYLKKNSKIIYLKTPFETIKNRLKDDKTRPLFNSLKQAEELYNFRKPLYKRYSDYNVNTYRKQPEEIACEILRIIKNDQNS